MTIVIDQTTQDASATARISIVEVQQETDSCAERIRQTAAEQGMSRKKLAKKAGIDCARLEECWRNGGDYTLPEIARIGAALKVAPAYFFGDEITETKVQLPTAEESGVHLVPMSILTRNRPQPGDTVQIMTTEDPRGTVKLRYHFAPETHEENLTWTSEEGVIATVGGMYKFLGTVECERVDYVLLGILPISDDSKRGA